MLRSSFIAKVERLIESQGTEKFVALALDEFDLTYIEDVPAKLEAWVLGRASAMEEEEP